MCQALRMRAAAAPSAGTTQSSDRSRAAMMDAAATSSAALFRSMHAILRLAASCIRTNNFNHISKLMADSCSARADPHCHQLTPSRLQQVLRCNNLATL